MLLIQYNEKIEKEYDLNGLSDEHLIRHDEMDSQLMLIKKRVKEIGRRFWILDITVLVFLLLYKILSPYYSRKDGEELYENLFD